MHAYEDFLGLPRELLRAIRTLIDPKSTRNQTEIKAKSGRIQPKSSQIQIKANMKSSQIKPKPKSSRNESISQPKPSQNQSDSKLQSLSRAQTQAEPSPSPASGAQPAGSLRQRAPQPSLDSEPSQPRGSGEQGWQASRSLPRISLGMY